MFFLSYIFYYAFICICRFFILCDFCPLLYISLKFLYLFVCSEEDDDDEELAGVDLKVISFIHSLSRESH